MGKNNEGLRSQKRAATRATICESANSLINDLGYKKVTIEMICQEAYISKRTFFNYFKSKEAAIIEQDIPEISQQQIYNFCNSENSDIIEDLLELLVKNLVHKSTKSIYKTIMNNPELLIKKLEQFSNIERDLRKMVRKRISKSISITEEEAEDKAHLCVNVSMALIKFLVQRWVTLNIEVDEIAIAETKAMLKKIVI